MTEQGSVGVVQPQGFTFALDSPFVLERGLPSAR
jgi:hypothetical protein